MASPSLQQPLSNRSRYRTRLIRALVILTTLLVIGYIGLLQLIPFFIEKAQLKASIEKGLHESMGVHFAVEELTVVPTLFHGIRANLNTTTITDANHHPLGDIRHITVQIRYLPLLIRRRPEIAKIELNGVHVPVGRYNLFEALEFNFEEPEDTGFIKPVKLVDTEFLLSNYVIEDTVLAKTARDLSPQAVSFQVSGDKLSLKHFKSNQPISVLGGGHMRFVTKASGSARPSRLAAGRRGRRADDIQMGRFNVFAEVPQAVIEENHRFSASDLLRLELGVRDSQLNLDVKYRKPQHQNQGQGTLTAKRMNLAHLQALGLQVGDTFGLPVPEVMSQFYLAGLLDADTRFSLHLTGPDTLVVQDLTGKAFLTGVQAARSQARPHVLFNGLNGAIEMGEHWIRLGNLALRLGGNLALRLDGAYNTQSGAVDARLQSKNLKLSSLKQTLASLGVPLDALQGRDLQGLLDLDARLTGTRQRPVYRGTLVMSRGSYQDTQLGLNIPDANARFRFAGRGLQDAVLRYEGVVKVNRGSLDNTQNNLAVGSLQGQIQLNGTYTANQKLAIPAYSGNIHVAQGRYRDPQSGVSVQGIQGVLRMANGLIHLDNFRGGLAGSVFRVNGNLSQDFKRYDLRLQGNNISIPRMRDEVLVKLPQAQMLLAQLQPYAGWANVDLRVSSAGQKMSGILGIAGIQGRIDVHALAVRTGMEDYPLQIPAMTLQIAGNRFTLPSTTIHYGPMALKAQGSFSQPGNYNVQLASQNIPLALVRDHQQLVAMLTGAELPEIWNTAGGFSLDGRISNRGTQFTLDFQDAGLSWEDGDFPLYNLNGRLYFKQAANGKPFISSRNLAFRYGNSPVAVDIQENGHLRFTASGELSPVVVNHFLVSLQSNATPYREIPFRADISGALAALPGTHSALGGHDLVADIAMDLNPNFKYKHVDPSKGTDWPDASADKASSAPPWPGVSDQLPSLPDTGRETPGAARISDEQPEGGLDLGPVEVVKDAVEAVAEKVRAGFESLRQRAEDQAEDQKGTGEESSKAENEPDDPAQLPTDTAAAQAAEAAAQVAPTRQELHRAAVDVHQSVVQATHDIEGESPTKTSPVTGALEPAEGTPLTPAEERALAAMQGDDNAYFNARLRWRGADLILEQGIVHLFEAGDVLVKGVVQNFLNEGNRFLTVHVRTVPEIALDRLSHGARENDFFSNARGTFSADVQFARDEAEALNSAKGWVLAKGVAIPLLTLQDVTGRMDMSGQSAVANIQTFQIPGVTTALTATTQNLFELPVTLEDVKISGSLLSVESLVDFNQAVVAPILIDQLARNFFRPVQQGDPVLPIHFRDGEVQMDEAILQNILLKNFTSSMSVYANGFFELTGARLEAAGGTARGYFSMNPREDNFMTLELNARNVSANALTRALLNTTGQIFGDMDGRVRFTTSGLTPEAMIDNANGTVAMKITDGRLPAIAKVETLLTAANIVRGGILNLNLNNILRAVQLYDTNYFAQLSGDMQIANGVMYTDNTLSDGEDLDLLIQGSLRLSDGAANMVINGTMNQEVSGKLGLLGQLSVGKLVNLVPGLGRFGNAPGLVDYIPGVGYIPGLGGRVGDVSRFQVRLVGDLDTPGAIQGFQWVRSPGL